MKWNLDPNTPLRTKSKFARWALLSLVGHVVLVQLVFTLPMVIVFLRLDFLDGTLSVSSTARTVWVAALGGLCCAAALWFTITVPLAAKQRQSGK
jgi:hypothetical protein